MQRRSAWPTDATSRSDSKVPARSWRRSSVPEPRRSPYLYAIVRGVPHVERGERISAGVVLLCRSRRFLGARTALDEARLAAIAPDCDPEAVRPHLEAIEAIARGDDGAGPMAR